MLFREFCIGFLISPKDLVIMLEMLIIMVMFPTGSMMTFRQTIGVKRTARKVMKGAMLAEFVTVLIWVCFAIQI